MKRLLMIAFHFPPASMGSGHLRTLAFVRHLPALGWEPVVVSAGAAAFPRTDAANNDLIPDTCKVYRTFALDVKRHLGIAGRYPGFLAQPDRWASWWPMAVARGLWLIRRHGIDAIWSTYPIMTAHRIASTLSRRANLPWVADFRDPVKSSVEEANPFSAASQLRCERQVLARAARVVFTTPGALQTYRDRFPEAASEGRLAVIPNGYDEAAFADLPMPALDGVHRPLRLLHSGILYSDGRDPVPFFDAVASLKSSGVLGEDDVSIVLRASGSEPAYAEAIRQRGLDGMISLAPAISNSDALREQADADGLLLFQGHKFDRQIPAKVYEYLRTGRPIFALVGARGETAALLCRTGGAAQVPLEDASVIAPALARFIRALRDGTAPRADPGVVQQYSRYRGAVALARLLDDVTTTPGARRDQ